MKNTALTVYQTKNGTLQLEVDMHAETLWLSQKEISLIFDTSVDNVSLHLKNIYEEDELDEISTTEDSSIVQVEGKRTVKRKLKQYNLDAIISVGYRINSKKATEFRKWATQTLRQHITQGYTINPARIATNYDVFMQAVADIRALLPVENIVPASAVLDLVQSFAATWLSLDAYDREAFVMPVVTKENIILTADELRAALDVFKRELIQKGEATDLFSQPKESHSLESIVANVFQSFGGEDVYPTIIEAAHLLYFFVKNHIFVDGNKRSGAFAFVWFLEKAGCLDRGKMNPQTLTALTLLIAESHPHDKEKMVGIVGLLMR